MIKSQTIISFIAIFALCCSFYSCGKEDAPKNNSYNISGVEMNTNSTELAIGDTITLMAIAQPYGLNVNNIEWNDDIKEYVYWKSNNPKVATISQDGLVTAIGGGTTQILFVCGGYAAKCTIIVRNHNINLLYGRWEIDESEHYDFRYDYTGSHQGKEFKWSFDGMRLKLNYTDKTETLIITNSGDGELRFYKSDDTDKNIVRMSMIATNITLQDLEVGLLQIEGKDGYSYEAVDLGLPSGVLWAKNNLLADSPEAVGALYAWGEIDSKEEFILENYKWYDTDLLEFTKYKSDDNISSVITLDYTDDAANVSMGGTWRIPTHSEIEELCNNCGVIWSKLNETNGLLFISLVDGYKGNSIFLPLTGIQLSSNDNTVLEQHFASYWTSTLNSSNDMSAKNFYLINYPNKDSYKQYYTNSHASRYNGACIRPVVNK